MTRKRCYGCMQLKEHSPVCEHCGFNEYAQNESHQLPLGTVLRQQYLVGKCLGQGGFGITYLGWDLNLDIPIAIKEYYPNSIVNRDTAHSMALTGVASNMTELYVSTRQRFLREAKVLAMLRNVPNIVQVHNFFEENNTAYIIMEYVKGIDLRRYMNLRGGRLSVEETLTILKPVMAALSKVHEFEIVHRDISPDNIMMMPDGTAKLLDFGAVRNVENADAEQELQQSTEAILKHGFAPMEQYQKRGSLGPWTDEYALCATVYYCLTGRVPPDAPQRMMEDVHPAWEKIPGLSAYQIQVLQKGMALRAKDRYASIRELMDALYGEATAPVTEPEPIAVTEPVEPMEMPQPVQRSEAEVPAYTAPMVTMPVEHVELPVQKKKKSGGLIVAVAAVAALAAVFLLFGGKKDAEPQMQAPETQAMQAPETQAMPAPTPLPPAEQEIAPAEVQDITLRVWCPSDYLDTFPLMLSGFEDEHPEYNITWDVSVCETYDLSNAVLNGGIDADVFMFSGDQLAPLVHSGNIAPLTGDALEQVLYDNSESMVQSVSYNGNVYGVPYSGSTWFMYYDKSVYTQEDIQSLDRMMQKGIISFPLTNSWYLSAFYFAAGGTMYGDGTDAASGIQFGGTNGVLATTYIVDALESGNMVIDDNGTGLNALARGSVHALFSGYWDAYNVQQILGDNFGVAKLPSITLNGAQKQLYSFMTPMAYGVSGTTKHAKAAEQLAAWLGSPEMQILLYEHTGCMPCSLALLHVSDDQLALAQIETLAYTSKMQPYIEEMAGYWDPATNFGRDLASGKINRSNAAQRTEEWNKMLNP